MGRKPTLTAEERKERARAYSHRYYETHVKGTQKAIDYRYDYYLRVEKPKRQKKSREEYERMNAFKKYVRECLKCLGMTQADLAESCGVTQGGVVRWLNLERDMKVTDFYQLCKTIGVDMEDLYKTYRYARMEMRIAKYREEHEQAKK